MNFYQKKIYLLTLVFSTVLCAQNKKNEKPEVSIGGALRFNYNFSSWKGSQKKRGGDFGFDVFRINTKAKYKGINLNAEYRFYPKYSGGGMLKHGWIGYNFNEKNNIQIGLTQVPFGITEYNSYSWFANINYYIGLEDDYDMGIKFTHKGKQWEYAFAYFKNAEELQANNNSDISSSRYSYDVSSIKSDKESETIYLRNKEVSQLNGKVNYLFGNDKTKHKIGTSIQYGGLYNLDTEKTGNHYALAAHYELKTGNLGIKTQISNYKYNTKNKKDEPDDIIAMGAYGSSYLVAAKATTYTFSAAYSIPVKWGPISNLQLYNDFGYMDKSVKMFNDSLMNVTGVLITAGKIYTYIDIASGKNQPWLGGPFRYALTKGISDAKWETRFNINIGYYF